MFLESRFAQRKHQFVLQKEQRKDKDKSETAPVNMLSVTFTEYLRQLLVAEFFLTTDLRSGSFTEVIHFKQ